MQNGFTLIEVIITLIIIGLLISLSLPIYKQHIISMHRLEAKTTLSKLSIAMEKYFMEHNTYESATLRALNFPEWIAGNNYKISIVSNTQNDYALSAKPQAGDDKCGTLILNSNGEWFANGKDIGDC